MVYRRMKMYQKVKNYCRKYHILEQGDRIVVGVSGGADSVCLLDMLCRMRDSDNLTIMAVHVHHGLRGNEADKDEIFTQQLCKQLEVPLFCFHEEVAERAKEEKMSLEEAGRKCRYERFEEIRQKTKSTKIAVAHHANDQAETVLFHLVRGSGIDGLAGILPVRERIIRPILCLTRKEVMDYLQERELSYRIDESNADLVYTRNKIRHQWIPMLEKMNPAVVQRIAKTASVIASATNYLHYQRDKVYRDVVIQTKMSRQIKINREVLRQEHSFMQAEVLRLAFAEVAGKKEDINAVHIEALQELLAADTGKKLSLPEKVTAWNEYEWLFLQKEVREKSVDFDYEFLEMGVYELSELGAKLYLEVINVQDNKIILKDTYKKMFDYDKIKGNLHIRNRESKDSLLLKETGGRKSLKRYMIDEKIPQKERDKIPVLADDEDVVWLIGYRIGAGYKVTPDTKRILIVKYEKRTKEKNNG